MRAPVAQAHAGIQTRSETWSDEYVGTREALIAAGLAKPGEFPGDPGRNKTVTSYAPDGTSIRHCRANQLGRGGRRIRPFGGMNYCVDVFVGRDEGMRRLDRVCAESHAPAPHPPRAASTVDAFLQRELEALTRIYLALGTEARARLLVAAGNFSDAMPDVAPATGRPARRRIPDGWRVVSGKPHA